VPVADPASTAGDLRRRLAGQRFESAAHVAACRDGRLVGLARIEDVLAADEATLLEEFMDPDPPVITHGVDEEIAAWKAVRHEESALAVVDENGRFVGIVSPRRIVEVLLAEHDEDLARLGGYLASTSSARHATEEAVGPRLGHRLPWLLVGLAGAIAAAGIMGAFEHQLDENVLLAFFVPGIVYMADAVGTQTEALVIRGLSVGVPVGRIIGRELLTGLLVGVLLAAAFLPVGLVLWDEDDVIVAVAIALLAACSTATLVAMTLPWVLSRLGHDPAFGSGPLATVIQDLLSLAIYFWVAALIV
jgi:magnesium transporter